MKETFALINDQDQVVNHIVIDKDDVDFESNMAVQLDHWGCVRYVETDLFVDAIVIDPSPTIWTTHTEETGFVLPVIEIPVEEETTSTPIEEVTINGKKYPADSLLIKENAALRPAGWTLPEGQVEVSLSDVD